LIQNDYAKKLNLEPYGLSFHVGSQQRDIGQWDKAISLCKYLFDALSQHGIHLKAINLGGGFPTRYVHPTYPLETYTKMITDSFECVNSASKNGPFNLLTGIILSIAGFVTQ